VVVLLQVSGPGLVATCCGPLVMQGDCCRLCVAGCPSVGQIDAQIVHFWQKV